MGSRWYNFLCPMAKNYYRSVTLANNIYSEIFSNYSCWYFIQMSKIIGRNTPIANKYTYGKSIWYYKKISITIYNEEQFCCIQGTKAWSMFILSIVCIVLFACRDGLFELFKNLHETSIIVALCMKSNAIYRNYGNAA